MASHRCLEFSLASPVSVCAASEPSIWVASHWLSSGLQGRLSTTFPWERTWQLTCDFRSAQVAGEFRTGGRVAVESRLWCHFRARTCTRAMLTGRAGSNLGISRRESTVNFQHGHTKGPWGERIKAVVGPNGLEGSWLAFIWHKWKGDRRKILIFRSVLFVLFCFCFKKEMALNLFSVSYFILFLTVVITLSNGAGSFLGKKRCATHTEREPAW